jgi:hypothetical protein
MQQFMTGQMLLTAVILYVTEYLIIPKEYVKLPHYRLVTGILYA